MLFSFLQALFFDCLLVALALTAHELGHAIVAHFFGVQVKEFGIRWTGPYVRRARTTGWREVVICVAGATVNLALAIAFWNLSHWFALFNFTVGVVNLLPITHSDGTHALEALRVLDPQTSPVAESKKKAA
ncbi:MAG TPA: hypothetical protein VMU92_13500 [Acidobacteriaceae bacterium]|nr:hypothetical protein [Acidobacteriaceae bacterium]